MGYVEPDRVLDKQFRVSIATPPSHAVLSNLLGGLTDHLVRWFYTGNYPSVQACVDAAGADSVIILARGWHQAPVIINENLVTMIGAGWNTIINGGVTGHGIDVRGDYCKLYNLGAMTTPGGGSAYDAFHITGNYAVISDVYTNMSDRDSIYLEGAYAVVRGSIFFAADQDGIHLALARSCRMTENFVNDTGRYGVYFQEPNTYYNVLSANVITNLIEDGVQIDAAAEDQVVVANNIKGWGGAHLAINDLSGTSTVASNDC